IAKNPKPGAFPRFAERLPEAVGHQSLASNEYGRIMRGILPSLLMLCVIAAGPAFAQQATAVTQNRDWGTYSYQTQSGKVCYVMSVPKQKEPASLNHGDIFFLISQMPGQNAALEPQFMTGYDMRDGSKVTAT